MTAISKIYESPKVQLTMIKAANAVMIYSRLGTLGTIIYAIGIVAKKIK